MARQAEAERERRAKVIGAQGEYEAAEQLSKAADRIAASPIALQLRYLQTLLEAAGSANTSTILPIPIDILRPLADVAKAIQPPTPAQPPAGDGSQ
jgi:regulator of protease activity HflC (stomatin/prohibitin superfamily)